MGYMFSGKYLNCNRNVKYSCAHFIPFLLRMQYAKQDAIISRKAFKVALKSLEFKDLKFEKYLHNSVFKVTLSLLTLAEVMFDCLTQSYKAQSLHL